MKKTIFIFLLPLAALAQEPNFPVYLHPEEECEEVVAYFRDNLNSIVTALSNSDYNIARMSEEFQAADELFQETPCYQSDEYYQTSMQFYRQYFAEYKNSLTNQLVNANNISTNLLDRLNQINCTTCIEDTPDVPGNTNGVNKCCDFTGLYQRLDTLIQLQTSIENHVSQLSNILSTVQQIKTNLDYTNFLLEHGFGDITNMLHYVNWESLQRTTFNPASGLNNLYGLRTLSQGSRFYVGQLSMNTISANAEDYGWLPSIWWQNFDQLKILGSLNSFELNKYLNFHRSVTNNLISLNATLNALTDSSTNFFTFFRGEIGVRGVLEDWQSEEVSGTYYDFLTNHYLSVVFGDSLSGYQAEKTNWFSRIETLLAALVFVDGSETNAYLSASEASSNSVSNAKNSFNSVFDGVSSAPSTQMELAVDIEKSMYNSLKSFSQAFSSASLPSTVRLLYVYKDGGGGGSLRKGALRSSGGSVDVTVDVDGKLSDFIEILRSCSTLCWVFFGLWFMFKFTVWTVKKIYLLIRYIIDFFNMVAGGK